MKGRSLRNRLIVGLVVGAALFVGLTAAAVFTVLRERVVTEFDEDLRLYAGALAGLVEYEDDEVVFEWEHYDPVGQMRADPTDAEGYLFTVWLRSGERLASSRVFDKFELPRPEERGGNAWRQVTLPDGTRARTVSFSAAPRVELDQPRPGFSHERVGVTVARRTLAVDQLLSRVAGALLLTGAVALCLGALAIGWFIHHSLRPLGPVVAQLDGLGDGDLGRRIDAERLYREFMPLIEVINRLLAGLESKVAQERRFIANAAHEFRNPVAAVRANLETAIIQIGEGRGNDPQLIRTSLDSATHLQGVCERLLELSGLESGRTEVESHPIEVVEFVESTLFEFAQRQEAEGLRVEWRRRESIEIDTDPVLLSMVLTNVIANALAHGAPGKPLRVGVGERDGGARLTFSNEMSREDSIDATTAAEPFGPVTNGRSGKDWHAGLGLAIARRAAERLEGRMACSIDEAGCFRVDVSLPLRIKAARTA